MTLSLSAIYRSKTARTVTVFASGNMVAMLLGMVGSLVQARYIGPEDMGVFRTFGIVAGYLTFLHLGVFDGLHREIPIQLGCGNHKKAEQAAASCLAWITFISLMCGSIFLLLGLRAAFYHDWMKFWGWLAYVPVIVGTFYGGYLGATFRTGQQFIKLSKASVLQAIAGTLVLPLLPIMGYYGACLRTSVTTVTNLLLLHNWRPMKVHPCLDWTSFRDVISIGLPLSGIGYIYTSLWFSLEGTFVLERFGIKTLGLYTMAVFVRTVVVQLAQNMNQVMSVKIYAQYGRSGYIAECVRLILQPMLLAFLVSLLLIVFGWFALPWVVSLLIPKYIEAISIMQVMLLAMPLAFLSLPTTILWATGRLSYCFASVSGGFVAFVALSYLFKRMDIGVLSILVASMVGQTINVLASYLLILKLILQEKRKLSNVGAASHDSSV